MRYVANASGASCSSFRTEFAGMPLQLQSDGACAYDIHGPSMAYACNVAVDSSVQRFCCCGDTCACRVSDHEEPCVCSTVVGGLSNAPNAIAVDSAGGITIAGRFDQNIVNWKPSGTTTLTTLGGSAESYDIDVVNYGGSSDVLFYTTSWDFDTGAAPQVRSSSTSPATVIAESSGRNSFDSVAVDAEGNIYVTAGAFGGVVQKWKRQPDSSYSKVAELSQESATYKGLAVGPGGDLFITDTQNHRVLRWDFDSGTGTTVAGGSQGSGLAQLNRPERLCVDAEGNIFVADTGNYRVMMWPPNATSGLKVGTFDQIRPADVACTSHITGVYVADTGNKVLLCPKPAIVPESTTTSTTTTVDASCPGGWLRGVPAEQLPESHLQLQKHYAGIASSLGECNRLAMEICPDVHAVTFMGDEPLPDGGACYCYLNVIAGLDTTYIKKWTCVHKEEEETYCHQGWQRAIGKEGSTCARESCRTVNSAVSSRGQCLKECLSSTTYGFRNSVRYMGTSCQCIGHDPGPWHVVGAADTADREVCVPTCQAGGWRSDTSAFNETLQLGPMTRMDCVAAVMELCPDAEGAAWRELGTASSGNCSCVANFTVSPFTEAPAGAGSTLTTTTTVAACYSAGASIRRRWMTAGAPEYYSGCVTLNAQLCPGDSAVQYQFPDGRSHWVTFDLATHCGNLTGPCFNGGDRVQLINYPEFGCTTVHPDGFCPDTWRKKIAFPRGGTDEREWEYFDLEPCSEVESPESGPCFPVGARVHPTVPQYNRRGCELVSGTPFCPGEGRYIDMPMVDALTAYRDTEACTCWWSGDRVTVDQYSSFGACATLSIYNICPDSVVRIITFDGYPRWSSSIHDAIKPCAPLTCIMGKHSRHMTQTRTTTTTVSSTTSTMSTQTETTFTGTSSTSSTSITSSSSSTLSSSTSTTTASSTSSSSATMTRTSTVSSTLSTTSSSVTTSSRTSTASSTLTSSSSSSTTASRTATTVSVTLTTLSSTSSSRTSSVSATTSSSISSTSTKTVMTSSRMPSRADTVASTTARSDNVGAPTSLGGDTTVLPTPAMLPPREETGASSSVTTTPTSTTTPPPQVGSLPATETPAAMADFLEDAVSQIAQTVDFGGSSSKFVKTENVVSTYFNMDKQSPPRLLLQEESVHPGQGRAAIALSRTLSNSLPAGTTMSVAQLNAGNKDIESQLDSSPFANLGGRQLASPAVSIIMFDRNGKHVKELSKPLLFRLPGGRATQGKPYCAYLDFSDAKNMRWSTAGVRTASPSQVQAEGFQFQEGEMWCFTDHLSIFAAIADIILGCTNAELLSQEGMSMIVDNDGWWQTRPAVLVFCVMAVLLFLIVAGSLKEQWELRLGRTHAKGGSVKICKAFMTIGPQMLKHKYAAFIVLARDLFNCMRQGRAKLRNPTLKTAIQRCFAVRTGVSNACVAQHCWNGGVWLDTKASLPNVVLCHKLEFYSGGAEEVIEHELRGRRVDHVLRRLVMTFLAIHPLLDSLRLGHASLSVLKRATMQLVGFCGVMATNAMLFNFSGDLRGWESEATCPIPPTSTFFIIVATTVSILLNVLPNQFLNSLAKQVHGQDAWNAIFWGLLLLYLLISCLVVMTALANLNPKDAAKWHKSMEWSLTIKFLGMPMVQAIRNNIMLEHFLHEDSKSNHIEVSMRLKDPHEQPLDDREVEAVESMAKRAVSARELVNFVALLGDKVMPNYNPETSTAEDVLHGAMRIFCQEQHCLQDTCLHVEVIEVHGLKMPVQAPEAQPSLGCEVTHLGCQEQRSRPQLRGLKSDLVPISSSGRCAWNFRVSFSGLELGHGLGFTLTQNGQALGTAQLPLEQLLKSKGFEGELPLHLPAEAAAEGERQTFMTHSVSHHSFNEFSGSKGVVQTRVGLSQQARLVVKVELPREYIGALAAYELKNLRTQDARHESEVGQDNGPLLLQAAATAVEEPEPPRAWQFAPSRAGYTEPGQQDAPPPDRLVVHSQKIIFLDLVSTVLADVIAEKNAFETVRCMLKEGDFHGVLDWLTQGGKDRKRYWVGMFAMGMSQSDWHKDLIMAMPTLIRNLKQECCRRAVADLHSKVPPFCFLPQQLLVVDQECMLFQDHDCLAEVQLAKSMSLGQKLVLQPTHFQNTKVVDSLKELGKPRWHDGNRCPWTEPYLKDLVGLAGALVTLVSSAVKLQKESDNNKSGQDLNLDDVTAVVAAQVASRQAIARDSSGVEGEDTVRFGPRDTGGAGMTDDAAPAEVEDAAGDGGDD